MPLQTTDLRDFKLLVRNAYHNLELVKQVLQSGAQLIEQQLDQDPQHQKAAPQAPSPEPTLVRPGEEEDAKARELMRLAAFPPAARFTTDEAALYLNCSISLLRTWRWQGRGPAFEGRGRLVRYVKAKLDAFMSA
jgi:hypothetical protein